MGKVWKKIKPSWLSRSHESLVFNSSAFTASDPPAARTVTPGPGLPISNGMSTSHKYLASQVAQQLNDVTGCGGSRGYSPSDFLTQSHNFPPLHTSSSQYFNSHHTHRHPKLSKLHHPSLTLDTSDNFISSHLASQPTSSFPSGDNDSSGLLLGGGAGVGNVSSDSSTLISSSLLNTSGQSVQLDPSFGSGVGGVGFASVVAKTTATTTGADNYLHMNGGPNGMGPLMTVGSVTATAVGLNNINGMNNVNVTNTPHSARTNSTSNLHMQSSTLDKQKLDRSKSTHFKFGGSAGGGSAFDVRSNQDCWLPLSYYGTSRALRYPNSVISPSPLPQNQSAQSLISTSTMIQPRASNFAPNPNSNSASQHQQQPPSMTSLMNVTSSFVQGSPAAAVSQMQMSHMQVQPTPTRAASSLRMHVLEMKGAPSGKKQRIYCQICVNGTELGRTTAKQKLDILFWGELFNFAQQQLRELEPMQKIVIKIFKESESKKKKKDKDSGNTFLGNVELSLKDIHGDWHETWYNVENKAKSCDTDVCTLRVRAVYQSVQVLDLSYYQELLEFLKDDSLLLYQVVEDAILLKEKEDFSTSLIQVLHYCDKIDSFFADVIEYELVKEANPRMVFRGNSLATKSMEAYLKFIGSQYLKETLQETIHEIYRKDECYEIDRQKLFPGSAINQEKVVLEQQEKFKKLCEQIWSKIQQSLEAFPWEIRKVFSKIKERLKKNYSNDVIDNIITGSIFLRFLCPAIMTPNFFGLHSAYPPDNTVRTLKLLAKLLQALANNSLLGDKENYMVFMNEFMTKEFVNMRNFLDIISTYSPQQPSQGLPGSAGFGLGGNRTGAVIKAEIDVAKECAIIHRMLAKIKDSPSIKSSHMTSTATASGNSKGRNLPTIIQTLTQYYMQCSAHYQQQPQHQHAQHSFMHQQTRPYNQSPQMNFSNSASAAQIKTSNHQAPPFMQQYPSAGVGLGLPGMGPGGAYPHQNAGGMQQQAVHGHQMGTTPSNPNVDHRGVLSVMPDQQNSAAHSFSALPAKQGSFESHLSSRAENQTQFSSGHPFNPVTGPHDPMKVRGGNSMQPVTADIMHSASNSEATYYNQPAVLLQHSHHINSTLPRSNRIQATAPAVPMSNGKMGVPSFASSFSVPPPPNYPPPVPSGNNGVDENYENMEVLKMVNRQQQQLPPKKSSTSSNSTVLSFTAEQIANPSEPVQAATPEQAQRVRINHTQSGSIVNLHCSTPTPTSTQTPPIDKSRRGSRQQQDFKHTKSRLGVSSLGAGSFAGGNSGAGNGSTSSTGKGAGGIYDAADQHYVMCQPSVSGEPFKAATRSATRTPTSEVNASSQSMSVQYANSDAVNEEIMKRNSKDDILFPPTSNTPTPDAKSPTSVPVQITPESRGLRSHTPTSNMERQSSSHGDFMTLANPIYDVYNADSAATSIGQTPIQRIVSPTAGLRRSESASSDGAMSDLSEVGSNLHRVQSDSSFPPSSFPSELDLPTSSHSHINSHHHHVYETSPSSRGDHYGGANAETNPSNSTSHHHHRRHNHKNQRRYSAESSSNNNQSEAAATSAGSDKHALTTTHAERWRHSHSRSKSRHKNDNAGAVSQKISDRAFRAETPEDLKFNDSLDNVFVPQSTTDCVMPSMSFKNHPRNNSQSVSAPVAPKEDDEEDSNQQQQTGGDSSLTSAWSEDTTRDVPQNDVPENVIPEKRSTSQEISSGGYKEKARRGDSLTGDSTNEPNIGSGGRSAFSAREPSSMSSEAAARKRLSLHTSGSRSPALKAPSLYETELAQLKNQLAERDEEMRKMRAEWEEKMNKMSDQMKKQNEAKDEHIARLAQSQEEDRKQLDSLLHEFSERDVLLNKKDEKIKILYQNNRKLLECCHKLKGTHRKPSSVEKEDESSLQPELQKMQSQSQDVSLDLSNSMEDGSNKQQLEESGDSSSANSASLLANGTTASVTTNNPTSSSASKISLNSDHDHVLSSNPGSVTSSANSIQRRVATVNEGRNSPIRHVIGAPPRSISSSGLSAVAAGGDPSAVSNSVAVVSSGVNVPVTAAGIDLIKLTKTLPLELQNSTPL